MKYSIEQQVFDSLKSGFNRKSLNLIESLGDNINLIYRGKSLLCWAKHFENEDAVNLLQEKGAEDFIDEEIWHKQGMELLKAIENSDYSKVDKLVEDGADIDYQDKDGNSGLILASQLRRINMVRKLLDKGADVNIRNNNNETALMFEARNELAWNVDKMIKMGADIDAQDNNGNTALINAAAEGRFRSVEALVKGGCNIKIKNNDGLSALDVVKGEGVRKLIFNAVKINDTECKFSFLNNGMDI